MSLRLTEPVPQGLSHAQARPSRSSPSKLPVRTSSAIFSLFGSCLCRNRTTFSFERCGSRLLAQRPIPSSGIYNSVLVIGENIKDTKTEIRFELKNEDPSDPHSIQNSGVKKVYKVNDYLNGIDTEQKAIERAYYELDLIRKNYSSININCATLLHLNENDVIVLEDTTVGENATARYIINSISRPIGTDIGSTMSVSRIYM